VSSRCHRLPENIASAQSGATRWMCSTALVNAALLTAEHEVLMAGGKAVEVIRLLAAGQMAIGGERK
jgi:hypothetical protein